MSDSLWPHGLQHARTPCPSPIPGVYSNSNHPTVSSSATCFSFCLQSFPVSESFPMSQLFASGGQSIGASASAWALPINIHDWFPLEMTGLISLQSKGLSRVFSSTAIWKHQFFGAQSSLWSNSHPYMTTGRAIALTRWTSVLYADTTYRVCPWNLLKETGSWF